MSSGRSKWSAEAICRGTQKIVRVYQGMQLKWGQTPAPVVGASVATLHLTSELTQNLYFTQSAPNGVTVNWGDGSAAETYAGTAITEDGVTVYCVEATHSYAEARDYDVCFTTGSGVSWWPGASFEDGSSVNTYGFLGTGQSGKTHNYPALTSFRFGRGCGLRKSSFIGCTSLSYITSPTVAPCTNLLSGVFEDCTALSSIPSDLFVLCTTVTSFYWCFRNCTSLTAIPSGLFDACISAIYFNGCFQDCSSIASIPSGLFDNCTEAVNFGMTGFSPNGCFEGCTSLSTIPLGLFDHCTKAKYFADCFHGCTSLTSIPSGLFDYCPDAEDFAGCFNGCTSLTSIPSGLFDNCTVVVYFGGGGMFYSGCFQGCSSIVSAVPELWDSSRWPSVTYHRDCFTGCTAAANYADIPSDWGGPSA